MNLLCQWLFGLSYAVLFHTCCILSYTSRPCVQEAYFHIFGLCIDTFLYAVFSCFLYNSYKCFCTIDIHSIYFYPDTKNEIYAKQQWPLWILDASDHYFRNGPVKYIVDNEYLLYNCISNNSNKYLNCFIGKLNNFLFFRCEAGSYSILESGNYTTPDVMQESIIKFQNTTFIILSVCLLIMILIVIVLSILVCRLRRQPRVKKRIIVNKNVTPLTYRPQPTSEQCEITIENCCNMNVCETVRTSSQFKFFGLLIMCTYSHVSNRQSLEVWLRRMRRKRCWPTWKVVMICIRPYFNWSGCDFKKVLHLLSLNIYIMFIQKRLTSITTTFVFKC